ncbi:MAG TPA: ester cyclase, partial [Kofleriaceae bacterium]
MKLWPIAICVLACKGHDKPAPPPPTAPTPAVIVDAKPPGPEKVNVAKVLACIDAENTGKLDVASCYTPKAFIDTPLVHADTAVAIARFATLDRTAFPDAKQEPRLVLAEDTKVVVVSLVTGTQAAPVETWLGVIPSHGKTVGFLIARQIDVDKAGLIVGEHQYYDLDTLASQLGVATSAQLAPLLAPTGKPPEVQLSTGAVEESDLLLTTEVLAGKLDNTSNENLADWFGDHFTLTDSDLPAPLDAAQTSAMIAAMRRGLEARPNPVGYTIGNDTAAVYLDLSITNDGPVPELGLADKPKDAQPTWYLPTLVVAKFASHRNRTGKLAAVWVFHRDRPAHDLGIVVGKVTFKDKVPDSNMLTA